MNVFELLVSYQSLFSAIGGALIATISSQVIEHRRLDAERRKSREREYLKTIDNVHALRLSLKEMMSDAQLQAWARYSNADSLDEQKRLDQEGARVADALFDTVRVLELQGDHLRAFGSKRVVSAHDRMLDSLWAYLTAVGEGAMSDGRILFQDYSDEISALRSQLDELIDEIRVDLGYERLAQTANPLAALHERIGHKLLEQS